MNYVCQLVGYFKFIYLWLGMDKIWVYFVINNYYYYYYYYLINTIVIVYINIISTDRILNIKQNCTHVEQFKINNLL